MNIGVYPGSFNPFYKGEIYVGAVGGAYSFVFTPTGIGTIEKVVCADGEELDLTNYDNW